MLPRPGGGVLPPDERKSNGIANVAGGGGLHIASTATSHYSGVPTKEQRQAFQPARPQQAGAIPGVGHSFYTGTTTGDGGAVNGIGAGRVMAPPAPSFQQQQAQIPQPTYHPQPQHQQTQQPYQQPKPQQQYQQQPVQPQQNAVDWNQWAPSGVNEQMLSMGSSMASSFLTNNMARYQPGVVGFWGNLKYYFAVNNSYVLSKLKVLLFPFLKKSWARIASSEGADQDRSIRYARPSVDGNAPDLYIPLMSFITYILVTGFVKGKSGSFTPEVLGQVMSACVVTQFLELLVMRLGLYFLQAPVVLLDILAFTSYKYVGLCVNMVVGLLFGPTGYYVSTAYVSSAIAYFLFKTMAHSIPPGNSSRELFILGFAALQFVVVWWLGYNRDLTATP